MKRILYLSFLVVLFNIAKSQVLINEVCYTNPAGGPVTDGFLNNSDYIELYNATPGMPVSMTDYYLTNDKSNLYKWKIPSIITIPSYSFVAFWCTGRNIKEPGATGRYHTNFDIQQCRDQWIMLTYQGVIKDSLFVRRTKPGDNWGKYFDGVETPAPEWKLINGGSTFNATFETSNNVIPAASIYLGYAQTPVFLTNAGFQPPATGQYDLFISDTAHFQINYTMGYCGQIGGTVPCLSYSGCIGTSTSATTFTYSDPINTPITMPGQSNVITAITIPKGTYSLSYLPSFPETNTYFDGADISVNPGFGVLSTVIDTSFFTSISASPAATIHVEYFDYNQLFSEGAGGATKPPNDAWLNHQRGFDVGFDDRTGYGCSLIGNIFNDATLGVSSRTVYPNFEVRAAGKDNFSMVTPTITPAQIKGTHMRDAFAQTYAMKYGLNLDGLHYKPIRTFVNGCYWGIYEFREIPDADYLEHYFKIPKDSSDILRQHVVGSIYNGSDTGWVTTPVASSNSGIFNYVRTFPVNVPGVYYNNTMNRLSKISFMDHFIYNSYLVNTDLPVYNNSWWRKGTQNNADTMARWRYFMWDMNNILGLNIAPASYTISKTVPMMTTPCVFSSTLFPSSASAYTTTASAYTGHTFMFNKLYANQNFRNDYLNRYMDLLNTVLNCNKLIPHLTYFRNMFTPEMALHTLAWGVNQPDWDGNMDTLKIRLTERCAKIDSLLRKCTNLKGPFQINIDVRPQGAGTVDFNSLHLNNFVWSGQYYQYNYDAPYLKSYLEAWPVDTNLYVFDHWEFTSSSNSLTASPSNINLANYLYNDSLSFVITESDNITAVFQDKSANVVFPTGFTPNGDGYNDVFLPLGAAAKYSKDYELRVWNRWGQEVFRSSEYSVGWDGNYGGKLAQTGVYAYLLTYKDVLGESKLIKGNVTLIR